MDIILLTGISISLLIILLTLLFLRKKNDVKVEEVAPQRRPVPVRIQHDVGGSRAQIARNQRNRARQATGEQNRVVEEGSDDERSGDDSQIPDATDIGVGKIGAKKRAKLEAKAEKKTQREMETQIRKDKKLKEALAEEERKKQEEKEKEEELKHEEAERLARELKEKQEYEEYLKMKAAFSVEEEGFDENADDGDHNVLQEFVEHIKQNKVVLLEELAKKFKLKTQATVDRIHELKADGIITGVIDDRGKFIYISKDELQSVAKFIRQRGRISIAELVESSNALVNLTPMSVS